MQGIDELNRQRTASRLGSTEVQVAAAVHCTSPLPAHSLPVARGRRTGTPHAQRLRQQSLAPNVDLAADMLDRILTARCKHGTCRFATSYACHGRHSMQSVRTHMGVLHACGTGQRPWGDAMRQCNTYSPVLYFHAGNCSAPPWSTGPWGCEQEGCLLCRSLVKVNLHSFQHLCCVHHSVTQPHARCSYGSPQCLVSSRSPCRCAPIAHDPAHEEEEGGGGGGRNTV